MSRKKPGKEVFLCTECGDSFPKWYGRCPSCGAWNGLRSYTPPDAGTGNGGGGPGMATARAARDVGGDPSERSSARPLGEFQSSQLDRIATGSGEFDRVVGGGLVPGSVLLVGGEPGVGKSTLLLQVAAALVRNGTTVLYASAEESPEQVRLRADRLHGDATGVLLLAENDLAHILSEAERIRPGVLVVDSIQTVFLPQIPSAPGSLLQVRESAMALTRWAKTRRVPSLLVGHVTKEGSLAGPKTLEHMVDTVLDMTGDPNRGYRLLQAVKNRFGSVQELGVFDMRDDGLVEIDQPSKLLLRPGASEESGSVVVPAMEGSRALLVEVQALAHPAAYANPQRVATGFDPRRLAILLGVMARWARLDMGRSDVFFNVAGGLRITEPAADLGVLLAVAGSSTGRCVGAGAVAFGEVGLGGEIRRVRHARRRLEESVASGYRRAILPKACLDELKGSRKIEGMDLLPVARVEEAVACLRPAGAAREAGGIGAGRPVVGAHGGGPSHVEEA
jgi:DNA repair protein RadA/Sms